MGIRILLVIIYILASKHLIYYVSATGSMEKEPRYLLYDVNYGEGFNLRRDVYVRFANLLRFLNLRQPSIRYILVLPPWGRLYHWFNNRNLDQLPWSTFFDVKSLNFFIPVIEFEKFLTDTGGDPIDRVYYLQGIPFDGKWSERVELKPCEASHSYHYSKSRDLWFGWMYGYTEQPIRAFACLSVQAEAKTLAEFIARQAAPHRSIMFDRGEAIIHGTYSEWSQEWWTARRSMVFAKRLRQLAGKFRRDHLNSTDAVDRTERPEDWRTMKVAPGAALGGPYLAVHLRRRDFLRAHPDATPSLPAAGAALRRLAEALGVVAIFIATDDPAEVETALAPALLPVRLLRYPPADDVDKQQLNDGELSIIDQIVCSHARHFVGTRASTVTYRVVEERSLMGFAREASIGVMCADGEVSAGGGGRGDCEAGTYWQPQFEPAFTIAPTANGNKGTRARSDNEEL